MRRPVLNRHCLSAVALSAVAMMVAGCGLTDEGPQPGVAAEVEGQTLELSQVDEALEDYCGLLAKVPDAQASPKAVVRSQFAVGWTQAIAVEHLAKEYDVPLPPEKIDRSLVEQNWGDLGTITDDNYESFEWLTFIQLGSAPRLVDA